MKRRGWPLTALGPQPVVGYVWTEYLATRLCRVVARRLYPSGVEQNRIPGWSRKHHYVTVCSTMQEAREAYQRRVNDLELQHCLIEECWQLEGRPDVY